MSQLILRDLVSQQSDTEYLLVPGPVKAPGVQVVEGRIPKLPGMQSSFNGSRVRYKILGKQREGGFGGGSLQKGFTEEVA